MLNLIFFLSHLFISFAHGENITDRTINLSVGQTHHLKNLQAATVHIDSDQFIKIYPQERSVLISSKKPGQSFLRIGSQRYIINVLTPINYRSIKNIKAWIKDKKGLKFYIKGNQIQINGKLHRLTDWQELGYLQRKNNFTYDFTAQIDNDIKSKALNLIESYLNKFELKNTFIDLDTRPKIECAEKEIVEPLNNKLKYLGLKIQLNEHILMLAPLIKVKIVIAEVNKNLHEELGVDWNSSLQAKLLPAPLTTSDLIVSLKALQSYGQGRLLSSPSLLARSGSEAEFLAGGEFPIKIANFGSRSVTWKKHGILLKIKPVADSSGRMSIQLETEISSIDPSQTVDGVPGLKINRMQSHFDLEKSRTISLSGLIKNNFGTSDNSVPFLNKLPILGELFKSHSFINNQTDLIIFVTPEVI